MYPKNNQLPQINSRQAQKTPGMLDNAFNINNLSKIPSMMFPNTAKAVNYAVENVSPQVAQRVVSSAFPVVGTALSAGINAYNSSTPYKGQSLYGENTAKNADLAFPGASMKSVGSIQPKMAGVMGGALNNNVSQNNILKSNSIPDDPNLVDRIGGSITNQTGQSANLPTPAQNTVPTPAGYTPENLSTPDFSLYRNAVGANPENYVNVNNSINSLDTQLAGYAQAHAAENLGINQAGGTIWKTAGEGEQGLNDVRYSDNTRPLTERLARLNTQRNAFADVEKNISNQTNDINKYNINERNDAKQFNLTRQDGLISKNKPIEVSKGATLYDPTTGKFINNGDVGNGQSALTPSEQLAREKFDYDKQKDSRELSTNKNMSASAKEKMSIMATVEDLLNNVTSVNGDYEGLGPYDSRVTSLGALVNNADPKALANKTTIANVMATFAKLNAGTSFTDGEKALLNRYLPQDTDSSQEVTAKINGLKESIQLLRKNVLSAEAGNLTGVSSNQPGRTATGGLAW